MITEQVKEWLHKADSDLGAAKILFTYLPEYKEAVAFHCQQAVEKYLKSYLVFLEQEFRHTHSLVYLLNQISIKDEFSDEYYQSIIKLEGYAVEFRYPNTRVLPTDSDLKEAIEIADKIRLQVESKMHK